MGFFNLPLAKKIILCAHVLHQLCTHLILFTSLDVGTTNFHCQRITNRCGDPELQPTFRVTLQIHLNIVSVNIVEDALTALVTVVYDEAFLDLHFCCSLDRCPAHFVFCCDIKSE